MLFLKLFFPASLTTLLILLFVPQKKNLIFSNVGNLVLCLRSVNGLLTSRLVNHLSMSRQALERVSLTLRWLPCSNKLEVFQGFLFMVFVTIKACCAKMCVPA